MKSHFNSLSLKASILTRIKDGYLVWINIVPHIPKTGRYTIGARIENKFLDLLELSYQTYYTKREYKAEKILQCILILDTLKFLIQIAWESKLISNQHYQEIALKLEEIGKMLYGWQRSLNNFQKKNRNL